MSLESTYRYEVMRGLMMKRLLTADEQYNKNLELFGKKDGIFAFVLFGIMCVFYAVVGCFNKYIASDAMIFVGIVFNVVISLITFALVKVSKQPITTVGLLSGKKVLSILIGSVLAILLFYCNCLSHIVMGSNFVPLKDIILFVVYYFTVSVCEELVFRGYILTRQRYILARGAYRTHLKRNLAEPGRRSCWRMAAVQLRKTAYMMKLRHCLPKREKTW